MLSQYFKAGYLVCICSLLVLMIASDQVLSPRFVDLDKAEENIRILGDDAGDGSGRSVSSGDINGDGYADVIIGAPYANPAGGYEAGETYVIFGSATPPATIDLNLSPADMTIYGDDASEHSGYAVSSGDINGDGYDDVIIGNPFADPTGGANAGATYIILGSSLPAKEINLYTIPSPADMIIYGDDAGDASGWAVSSGDINGDGYDDVIIGAHSVNDRGGTYVIFGSASPLPVININNTEADMSIYGHAYYDYFGIAVSSGDINGDGFDDVIIGASKSYLFSWNPIGETYVIFGSAAPPATIDLNSVSADMTIYGDYAPDQFGCSVSSGDINGDGYADVIIGARFANPAGGYEAGETYVIFGSTAPPASIDLNSISADMTIYGDDAGDKSGYSVSSGDINGDGYADVIIGASGADPAGGRFAGETYIILGSAAPPATVDLNSTSADMTISGDDAGDGSGWAVSSGDINGNGYADVIIGAIGADPGGELSAGETYVILGSGLPIECNFTDTDISDWEKVGTGRAVVRDGQLILRRTSSRYRLFPKGALASKYDIETQLIRKGGRASRVSSSIFFSYLDKRNYWELKMLLLPEGKRVAGKWILRHKKNGFLVEKQVIKDDIYRNQQYQVKIEVRTDQIRVLVDGVEKFNIKPDEKPGWGKVALGSAGSGQSLFDDLKIY